MEKNVGCVNVNTDHTNKDDDYFIPGNDIALKDHKGDIICL